MTNIIPLVLKVLLGIFNLIEKDAQKRSEFSKKVQAQLDKYQAGVEDAAKVREQYDKMEDELAEEWKKKWAR